MKISVVIGTYNQKEILKLVLESFFKQSLPANDSFSTDGTDQMIESLTPTCRLNYLRRENQGKAAARNFGVSQAKAEIILLTDADMIADPDLLKEHVQLHEKKPNVSIEGVTLNLKKEIPVAKLAPCHPEVEPYIKQRLRRGQKLKWSYFLSGNLSLTKKAFEEAGGFDENFSVYGWEDIELGLRLSKMGVRLLHNPEAINYHYHFVSSGDMLQRKYNMGKSAAYFYKKHPTFEVKMFLGMNPVAMAMFNFLKKHPKILTKIKNQYILEEYQYRLGLTEALRAT